MTARDCRDARTRLLARAADHDLTPREALGLATHLAFCPDCRREQARMKALQEGFERIEEHLAARYGEVHPPEDLPARIMARVRAASPRARRVLMALLVSGVTAAGWYAAGGRAGSLAPRLPIVPALGRAAADAAVELGRTLAWFLSEAPMALISGGSPAAPSLLNTLLIVGLGAGSLALLLVAALLALVHPSEPLGPGREPGEPPRV